MLDGSALWPAWRILISTKKGVKQYENNVTKILGIKDYGRWNNKTGYLLG